jgi:hypothetical protein
VSISASTEPTAPVDCQRTRPRSEDVLFAVGHAHRRDVVFGTEPDDVDDSVVDADADDLKHLAVGVAGVEELVSPRDQLLEAGLEVERLRGVRSVEDVIELPVLGSGKECGHFVACVDEGRSSREPRVADGDLARAQGRDLDTISHRAAALAPAPTGSGQKLG